MKKNVKRINESQLRAIVAESVKKVLKESGFDNMSDADFEHFMKNDFANSLQYKKYKKNVLDTPEFKERARQDAQSMMKNKSRLKKTLNEGTTNPNIINAWDELKETVGADTMLDCIFQWSSANQLAQYIEWFEEEGYLTPEENEI